MFEFTAQASSTTMEFSSTGPMVFAGTLVDDIKIFECPGDMEKPEVLNVPENLMVECESQVPKPPSLITTDNCDPNPKITLKETKETVDPCTKKITREWSVKDVCDNETIITQIIDVIDQTPPDFTKLPENKYVKCEQDVLKELNDWLKKNGNATAKDDCGTVTWRSSYDRNPHLYCDTIITEFIAVSPCGLESSEFATFFVIDTTSPKFIIPAQSKSFNCISGRLDSLRNWLSSYGFSKVITHCDTFFMSHNFDNDSSKNPIVVSFYANDRCGNIDSSIATFSFRSSSDTFRIVEYSCNIKQNSLDTSFFTSNGCDSIVISEKIKLYPDTLYIQNYTCDTLMAGYDTIVLTNVSGCDSTVFTHTEWKSVPLTFIKLFDCHFPAYRLDTATLQGQFCDSIVITEYIPLQKDTIMLQLFTCDSSKAGQQTQVFTNIFGCDSLVITLTTLSSVQTHFRNSFECGLLAPYSDTLVFQTNSCDSLVITQHLPLKLDTTRLQSQTCDPMMTGLFQRKFINQSGCDSLVIERIDLLPSDSINILNTTCILSQAGIFTNQYKNRFGCDSIVRTNVQFIPSDTTMIRAFTCDPSLVRNDTLVYQTSTCDSVVFRSINLLASDTLLIQQSTCLFAQSGYDTLRLTNTAGCDSLVFIYTAFIPSDTIYLNSTTCNPLLVGLDTLSLRNRNGCDSIIYISSTFLPVNLSWSIDSIRCFNSNDGVFHILNTSDFTSPITFYVNGNAQSGISSLDQLTPGIYTIYLSDQKGCISQVAQFELFNPSPLITDLGADQNVKKGSPVKVSLTSNKVLQQIIWLPNHPNACLNCKEYDFVADQDIWIYSLAIDDRGCNQLDSVFIKVQKTGNVFAPNVFSPNGDNINDYFYIHGEDNAIVEQLSIFNRWGELLFETRDIPVNKPASGWDGSFNGERMIPGVYIFYAIVNQNDSKLILQGDLNLIR